MDEYFYGIATGVIKEEEKLILKDCKNTGKMAEDFICKILKEIGIEYKKNMRIPADGSYIHLNQYILEHPEMLVKCIF
jgi:hypothetical protein